MRAIPTRAGRLRGNRSNQMENRKAMEKMASTVDQDCKDVGLVREVLSDATPLIKAAMAGPVQHLPFSWLTGADAAEKRRLLEAEHLSLGARKTAAVQNANSVQVSLFTYFSCLFIF